MSIAWVPIEPVEPRMRTLRMLQLLCVGRHRVIDGDLAEHPEASIHNG